MSEAETSWLVGEVEDLLDSGAVGLYEFIWLLRPAFPELTDDEMESISTQVLDRLLGVDGTRLVRLVWPGAASAGKAERSELQADWWQTPGEHPYPAVVRD